MKLMLFCAGACLIFDAPNALTGFCLLLAAASPVVTVQGPPGPPGPPGADGRDAP